MTTDNTSKHKPRYRTHPMTNEEADRIIAEVEADVEAGRGTIYYPRKGRPSLSGAPAKSPSVAFRLTPELRAKVEDVAVREGLSVSALARHALEEYLRNVG